MEQPDSPKLATKSLRWLSVLPLWNAIMALVGGSMFLSGRLGAAETFGSLTSNWLLGVTFLILLGLATGVAIWIRRPWGWWLATYYFLYNGVRSLNVLVSALASGRTGSGLTSPMLDLVIGFGVAIYLYTPGALAWFGVSLRRKWSSALLLVGAVVGTIFFFLLLALFL